MMKSQNQPLNIILLGDPASGKGTQARLLAKKYHCYNFDMGKEVRKPAIRKHYDYAHTTARGKLTPTLVARGILKRIVREVPRKRGILFNGHPKMIGEAKLAARSLAQYKRSDPVVIYLTLPMRETLRRALHRVTYVGGKRMRRDDDTLQGIRNRKKYYVEQVSQVVRFFKKKYHVAFVSGVGSRAQVTRRIDAVIEHHLHGN